MNYPPDPYGGYWDQSGWQGQQPGWQGQQPGWAPGPPPDNYLVWAILTTILCCLPTGIVSIVYSNKVSELWTRGLYADAQTAANNAKKWAIISAIVAGVLVVGYIVAMIVMFVVGASLYWATPRTPPTTTHYRHY
jgi:hypothetical protein